MPARGQAKPGTNSARAGGCQEKGCGHASSVHAGIAASRDRQFRPCTMPGCSCLNFLTSVTCSRCGEFLPNRRVIAKLCEKCDQPAAKHETTSADKAAAGGGP